MSQTISPEQAVSMANTFYQMRKMAKFLSGEKYPEMIAPYKDIVQAKMEKHGIDAVRVFLALGKGLQENMPDQAATAIMWLGAAVVELSEGEG